jgi:hypothetical protein
MLLNIISGGFFKEMIFRIFPKVFLEFNKFLFKKFYKNSIKILKNPKKLF